jgi:hypothetical protein
VAAPGFKGKTKTLRLTPASSDLMNFMPTNPDAVAWIERYARCEISLEELCGKVRHMVGKRFVHNPKMRLVNLNQVCHKQAVRITSQHIEILFAKRRRGEITEQQMVAWANMVTANAAYFWEPDDADVVATWVNFLSLDFRARD